jgi:hypothetical protein
LNQLNRKKKYSSRKEGPKDNKLTLNPIKLGLSGGIIVSLTLFGSIWHAILTNLGYEFLKVWGDMHFWYEFVPIASPLGSLVSLADGFVHGFVYLFIFAWLYNWLEKRK